jgi:hypothetical protein
VDCHPSFSCNLGFAAGAPWAKIYKRDFLIKNHLMFVPGLSRSQDRIFNLYVYEAADKIKYIDKSMSHYVANDTSAVVSYRPNVEDIYQVYLKKIREFVQIKRCDSKLFFEAYNICICYVIQQIFKQYLFHKENKMSLLQKYKEVRRISENSVYALGIKNCVHIRASLTKKQYIVFRILKMRWYLFATLAMNMKSRSA